MSTKGRWIDFRELCKRVNFSEVLKHYNIELRIKGDQAMGFCPLPGHQGQKRSPSFSVNLGRGIWQCFGCGAKGNVIDLVARMEGLDPSQGKDIRKAAEILQESFGRSSPPPMPAVQSARRDTEPAEEEAPVRRAGLPLIINAPLDFELKNLDYEHPYPLERGFTHETIREFGLGYCNRGMLKYRLAIPIHDSGGNLLGYAGRVVDDTLISEANPKYKLPAPRDRNGQRFEFHKSALLYNVHRVPKRGSDLVVVEGFPSVWWLWQHGFKHVVALMGCDCGIEQARLILERVDVDGRIWIMPDGDDPGRRCAESLLRHLTPYRFVRWAKLREGEQPTQCGADDLNALMNP